MIDLHSHILPGVDDGSRNVDQSVRVLEAFAAKGITDVACTPHMLASNVGPWPERYETAWTELSLRVPAGIRLHRGAELMLDRPVPATIAERNVTLAGSRYLLVEFNRMVPSEIVARALSEVIRINLVPVVAHPERYSSCSVETVREWRDLGAVIQVDATTMTLPRSRGDRARDLVSAGLADILAADNHGDSRNVATAHAWLTENGGAAQAEMLLVTNPRAILDDVSVYEVDPLPNRSSFWRSMRRLLRSE